MSKWHHVICAACWKTRPVGLGDPLRVFQQREEVCCFCGATTMECIYVHCAPALAKCGGNHPVTVG